MVIPPSKGRGAAENPANRFIPLQREPYSDYDPSEDPAPKTLFFMDRSKTILAENDSPDIPARWHLNPYRGCEHGCAYCYARPTHEYLGYSAGMDFETRILVKQDAPKLLREKLLSPSWVPEPIAISGVTDAYQPIERRERLTRRCLEVFVEFRQPVGIVTKNALVARDRDLLAELAQHQAVLVMLSITTLDTELARTLEPRASAPDARLRAIRQLTDAGVPCGVMFAPVIPGLNEHEVTKVLTAAKEAGAVGASYVVLRLPHSVKDVFQGWLDRHRPELKEKILGRIREIRGGALNSSDFRERMTGTGLWSETFRAIFRTARIKAGLSERFPAINTTAFRRPGGKQLRLFDDCE
jgi:DNA repair photolyase